MRRRRKTSAALSAMLVLCVGYGAVAYFALPEYWTVRDRRLDRGIDSFLTTTPQGIPGDPINVGLIGSKAGILRAFAKAGWNAADALTLRSSLDIGLSVVLDRPYADAPVSTLIFDGRRQDLAFERPIGDSADSRHHVRFWKTGQPDTQGNHLWLGSASFDRDVGFSRDTGQITHHIGPDVDAERETVMAALMATGALAGVVEEPGVGATRNGRNGGGDPYFTDGMIRIGTLRNVAEFSQSKGNVAREPVLRASGRSGLEGGCAAVRISSSWSNGTRRP